MASGRNPSSRNSSTATEPCRFDSGWRSAPTIRGRWAYAGRLRPERLEDRHLPGRRGQQVLAADHVGHLHVRVVHRRREHVRGVPSLRTITKSSQVGRREVRLAADQVVDGEVPAGHREAHVRAALGLEGGALLGGQVRHRPS